MPRKNQAVVGGAVTYQIPAPAGGVQLETFIPWTLVKRGVKREVITPLDTPEAFREEAAVERQARKASKDSALVRALGLAHYWQTLLDSGKAKTPADIARLEAMNIVQVREILRLTLLAPDIIEAMVDARGPRRLTLECLLRRGIPRDWEDQRRLVEGVAFRIPNHRHATRDLSAEQVSAGALCGPACQVVWGPGAKHPRLPDWAPMPQWLRCSFLTASKKALIWAGDLKW